MSELWRGEREVELVNGRFWWRGCMSREECGKLLLRGGIFSASVRWGGLRKDGRWSVLEFEVTSW